MIEKNETAPGGHQPALSKAVEDLERAEQHLAHARADEAAAEREVVDAIREVKEVQHDEQRVRVHVVHVNEVEKASFEERITATLGQVWDKSYDELKIERKPKDVFQTGGEHPKSLMGDLSLTLREARERKVIKDFDFGIASETGGAGWQ